MISKSKYRSLLLLAMLALFSACETEHYFDQFLVNESSQTLKLTFFGDGIPTYGDSLEVAPGTEKQIRQFMKRGAEPEGIDCGIDSTLVKVVAADGRVVEKDISDEGNWESKVSGKKVVQQECRFRVRDADLR